jgi:hypothetical protein
MFDKPHLTGPGATVGIKWGMFVALTAAGLLIYAGSRVRAAHRPEPPLSADIRLPDERPHLARTEVLDRDQSSNSA